MYELSVRGLLMGAALLTITGCAATHPGSAEVSSTMPVASGRLVLKAVLFPYIPDSVGDKYQSLIQRLKSGFESKTPNVDLQIIIDDKLDPYDYAPNGALSKLLGSGEGAAQVVEVDTILMGNLAQSRWVVPVGIPNPGVLPTAWQAASIQGVAYGVPTYLCTNVVYAENGVIASAVNGTNLVALLAAIKPGLPPLIGNYKGSWALSSTYIDAWADTNGTAGMAAAYQMPLDQKTMTSFPLVVNACATNSTKNPCLDGSYKDNNDAEVAFAKGGANGFIGYTERLFYIRQANNALPLPYVISAPIGGGSNPAMFVDALVFNPGCTGACLSAAQAFATYMSTVAVRNLIAFSQDGPSGTLPRYLLQANQMFYASEPASSDPMYKAYAPIVQRAQPYPNSGFPDARKALNAAVESALSPPTAAKTPMHPAATAAPPP